MERGKNTHTHIFVHLHISCAEQKSQLISKRSLFLQNSSQRGKIRICINFFIFILSEHWFPADLYLNCSINPNFWTAFYLASSKKTHLEYCSPPTTLFWSHLLPCSPTANEDLFDKTVTLFSCPLSFSKLDWCTGLHFNISPILS